MSTRELDFTFDPAAADPYDPRWPAWNAAHPGERRSAGAEAAPAAGQGAGEGAGEPAGGAAALTGEGEGEGDGGPAGFLSALDEDNAQLVKTKGWTEPNEVIRSYRELESAVGKKGVTVPGEKDGPEAWDKFFDAIGAPKEPDAFELKPAEGIEPTETDQAFMEAMKPAMAKARLTPRQAEILNEEFNRFTSGLAEQQSKSAAERDAEMDAELDREFGDRKDEVMASARQAAKALAATPEEAEALNGALGDAGLVKFFHRLSEQLGGETGALPGGRAGAGSHFSTPEAAAAKAQEIRAAAASDPEHPYRNKRHPEHQAITDLVMQLEERAADAEGGK